MKQAKFIFSILTIFFIIGIALDEEAERVVSQLYSRNSQGIILGAKSIAPKHPCHQTALIFIHGFADTPQVFNQIIRDLKFKINADIYAPLLPYHGRDLASLQALDNHEVMRFIQKELAQLGREYKAIIVVAHSYSGAILSQLLAENQVEAKIFPILYAPANYIQLNTPLNVLKNHVYGLWRHYCNYESLGCARNFRSSDDPKAQLAEINLQYKVLPAIHALFALDLKTRKNLRNMTRPFDVLISNDDSRLNYAKIAQDCHQNSSYCSLHTFNHGKHMPHYGTSKQQFEAIIIQRLRDLDPLPS